MPYRHLETRLATIVAFALPVLVHCGMSDTVPADERPNRDAGADAVGIVPPPLPDASAPADGGSVASCEVYCGDVAKNCVGAQSPYRSEGECLAACARLPEGAPGDVEQNTRSCRAYYAARAGRTENLRSCAAAGLLGGEVCGGRCEAFCGLAMSLCGSLAPFESTAACLTRCASMPGFPYENAGGEGLTMDAAGDTLNCRARVLRDVLVDESRCVDLGVPSATCSRQ